MYMYVFFSSRRETHKSQHMHYLPTPTGFWAGGDGLAGTWRIRVLVGHALLFPSGYAGIPLTRREGPIRTRSPGYAAHNAGPFVAGL